MRLDPALETVVRNAFDFPASPRDETFTPCVKRPAHHLALVPYPCCPPKPLGRRNHWRPVRPSELDDDSLRLGDLLCSSQLSDERTQQMAPGEILRSEPGARVARASFFELS